MNTSKTSAPRERILEVVDRLFYTEGVRATGTEKIMSLAGVAKATFYRHFESKDALVLAYLEHRDRALWDYMSHPTAPKNLREALTKFEQWANPAGSNRLPVPSYRIRIPGYRPSVSSHGDRTPGQDS